MTASENFVEISLLAASATESSVDPRCVRGIGSVGGRKLILIDIEALMARPESGLIQDGA